MLILISKLTECTIWDGGSWLCTDSQFGSEHVSSRYSRSCVERLDTACQCRGGVGGRTCDLDSASSGGRTYQTRHHEPQPLPHRARWVLLSTLINLLMEENVEVAPRKTIRFWHDDVMMGVIWWYDTSKWHVWANRHCVRYLPSTRRKEEIIF